MSTELLDIQPRELKFLFEVKKQSSSSVQLVNKTDAPVAFKVKTTTPKKYSVRPNVGIVKPQSTCDVIVIMQAQRIAPLDLVCKDKFLLQGIAVPEGTTDEDITPNMFSKDDSNYVEEFKLRVILESPPPPLVLSPINGVDKEMPTLEAPLPKVQVLDSVQIISPQENTITIDDSADDITQRRNRISENISPPKNEITKDFSSPNNTITIDDSAEGIGIQKSDTNEDIIRPQEDNFEGLQRKVLENEIESKLETRDEVATSKSAEPERMRGMENLDLVKDVEKMKSKLNELESKLTEAEVTFSKLTEERRLSTQEREILRKELAMSKSWNGMSKVQIGFPLFFVVLVALGSILLGYILRC